MYLGAQSYLNNPDHLKEDLIRFVYADKRDLCDGVTYQKGGRILNTLRHYLGNDAFYKGRLTNMVLSFPSSLGQSFLRKTSSVSITGMRIPKRLA
jgi:hypothetical protein